MNLAQLRGIMPSAGSKALVFLEPLNAAMIEFHINNYNRETTFIAQLAHESGQFRYVRELASGKAYEGRKDLGNTNPGDGVKYKGRGLIQLTGKANYIALMMALDIDCVEHPELVELPENACRSAGWFWETHGLNKLADEGNFLKITRRINGGTNGLADRQAFYTRAKKVLS